MCIFSQRGATVGFRALTLGRFHHHRATKARAEHIHFTDGEWRRSCPMPFKEEAQLFSLTGTSGSAWHHWEDMRSCVLPLQLQEGIVCRKALLRHSECAQWWRGEWWTELWINPEMLMAPWVWVMLVWSSVVITLLHEMWHGFSCGATRYDQKAFKKPQPNMWAILQHLEKIRPDHRLLRWRSRSMKKNKDQKWLCRESRIHTCTIMM